MRRSETALRATLFAFYWAVAFIALFLFSKDDSFCGRPGARSHTLVAGQLSLALAAYDAVVSLVVATTLTAALKNFKVTTTWVTTLVVGFGVGILPSWIYRGYGHFRFENSWADVSCFFTEANEFGFLVLIAPLLILTTFAREIIVLRFGRRQI